MISKHYVLSLLCLLLQCWRWNPGQELLHRAISLHSFYTYAGFFTDPLNEQGAPFGFHCSLQNVGLCMQQGPLSGTHSNEFVKDFRKEALNLRWNWKEVRPKDGIRAVGHSEAGIVLLCCLFGFSVHYLPQYFWLSTGNCILGIFGNFLTSAPSSSFQSSDITMEILKTGVLLWFLSLNV